jgi:hypothetical protein
VTDRQGFAERLGRLPSSPWFAYPAVFLVQARALWGIWHDDLSPGDTAGYWQWADLWFDHEQVNIAWSPLYTAGLGALRWLSGDDATVAIPLHRALIALAVALLLLAVMRRLLPAPIALLVACWWAVLPIAFDTIVEVHLFAVLPVLLVVLLLTNDPGPWRRGSALAVAFAAAVLVRNETALVVVALLAALAWSELRGRRQGSGTAPRQLAIATLVPLVVALAAVGAFHERSIFQGQAAREMWQAKQTLNVCQVFGTNYQQRNAEYRGNPFVDCDSLMTRLFDKPRPTLADAWQSDAGEMAAFTAWNLHLLPAGVQLGLFNAVTADDNPDYPPAQLESWWATLLTVVLVALLALGGRRLWRARAAWAPWLRGERWAWFAFGAIGVVTLLVVVFDARPRPAYMFGLTTGLMAVTGLALAALVRDRERVERGVSYAAVALAILLVVALPAHYGNYPRPLAEQYERLRPAVPDAGPATLVVPRHSGEACAYLVPIGSCRALVYRRDIAPQAQRHGVPAALRAAGADALYADAATLADPAVARLVANPLRSGWRLAGAGEGDDGKWAVLVRQDAPFTQPPRR